MSVGMSGSISILHTVENSQATPLGKIELISYSWNEPVEATLAQCDDHIVNYCLASRPADASARFADVWAPNRFERIGEVFLLPAGCQVETRSGPGRHRSLVCRLAPDLVGRWLDTDQPWSDSRLSCSLDIGTLQVRRTICRIAQELDGRRFARDIMLELLHMQLAIEIGRSFDDIPLQACGGLAPWRLRAIDERINDAVPPPTLEELAMLVGLSVRQLTRGFRTSKGKSIGAFVEQKRIEQSKRLLQMNLPIKEVASRMGFSSPSGFAHSFKTATGETPRMFRGLHGASATPTAGRSRTAINSMVP